MKLSKDYIINRLKATSVHDLAVEIAEQTAKQYPTQDMDATVAKFEKMIAPYAPNPTVADIVRATGITVVEIGQ